MISYARAMCLLFAIVLISSPLLAQDEPATTPKEKPAAKTKDNAPAKPAESIVIQVILTIEDNQEHIAIRASDGIPLDFVSEIHSLVANSFDANNITLVIVDASKPIDPAKMSHEQQFNIRITGKNAELFVSEKVPFNLMQSITELLRDEPIGVDKVVLRSNRNEPANASDDPFGHTSSKLKGNSNRNYTVTEDPFGQTTTSSKATSDNPFGN